MKKDELVTALTSLAVSLFLAFGWLFCGKDILRWLVTYGATISWTAAALVAVIAVVVVAVKLAARLNPPKRYGTIPAETIRNILK